MSSSLPTHKWFIRLNLILISGCVRIADECNIINVYLRYGHHEALVTTVDIQGRVNTAPMGIELLNVEGHNYILVQPYINTETYRNLLNTREAVINVTSDVMLYYYSLFNPSRLGYESSRCVRPPRISGYVDLYVEGLVEEVNIVNDRAYIKLKPLLCVRGCGSNLAFSRANALVIEALTQYTKLPALISLGYLDEVRRRFEVVKYAREVVGRIGSKDLVEVVEVIYHKCLDVVRNLLI